MQNTPGEAYRFEEEVARFVVALRAAAPKGVSIQRQASSPRALGWSSSASEAGAASEVAAVVQLMTPSGVTQRLGLLPRQGRYQEAGPMQPAGPEFQAGTPQILGLGPGLVVVAAPSLRVALTQSVEAREWPLLEQALATTLGRWRRATRAPTAEAPPGLEAATKILKHPYYWEVELPAGHRLDPKALERIMSGPIEALMLRPAPPVEGGLYPVPILLLRAP